MVYYCISTCIANPPVSEPPLQAIAHTRLPTFTPSAGAVSTGLELLAAAASSTVSAGDAPTIQVKPGNYVLNKPGPFNPVATLAPRVAKNILELDFVEMAESPLMLHQSHHQTGLS